MTEAEIDAASPLAPAMRWWAKVGTDGHYPERYHPLPHHLLDAGMVAQAMWDRFLPQPSRRFIAGALGLTEKEARSWVGFLTALHDLCNATPVLRCQRAASIGAPTRAG